MWSLYFYTFYFEKDALCGNRSLVSLNLDDNEISDSGAIAIASLLLQNNCLTKIHLASNQITTQVCACVHVSFRFE